jgi:hypothetical protein
MVSSCVHRDLFPTPAQFASDIFNPSCLIEGPLISTALRQRADRSYRPRAVGQRPGKKLPPNRSGEGGRGDSLGPITNRAMAVIQSKKLAASAHRIIISTTLPRYHRTGVPSRHCQTDREVVWCLCKIAHRTKIKRWNPKPLEPRFNNKTSGVRDYRGSV